jgi:ATP-dependent helicase HepA
MTDRFQSGQRWTSETEPELGLGTVLRVSSRTVSLTFGASEETREYALDNAPLRRVRFRTGDVIRDKQGASFTVDSINERSGLLFYRSAQGDVCETDLNDSLSFNKPEERLLAGQVDPPEVFALRLQALEHQHRRRKSPVRGFVGGRIDLLPHQLYIASEVTGRLLPRVLLADEVGLGKTIEACLILHRLIGTGRAQRVLVLVPESLVHQWFVELLRRFNLWFHIFDEERCEAIVTVNPEANPFLDDQLVLSSISLFTTDEQRLAQALESGWDLVVVDEAHHLGWSPEQVSPEYAVVEQLSRRTPGLLLLTATPGQLGVASHFARLRLLDPDRFFSLEEFIKETETYGDIARAAEKLLSRTTPTAPEVALLARILIREEDELRSAVERIGKGDEETRTELLDALLDQHGTGRVMFRNTRATVTGFPARVAHLHPLIAQGDSGDLYQNLATEFAADTHAAEAARFEPEFSRDPRIDWLADLLRNLGTAKVLLICRTARKVEAIDAALRQRLSIKMAVFHEGLPLVKRDRNAAWFAEDDGARLLLCSEIGSEGRNFQFAHHLVLFDLPLDPELLEQRLGRLDRIGQRSEIQVHVPYVQSSPEEVLARWYHEGLNSFEKNLQGGRELLEQFGARVHDLAQDYHETEASTRTDVARLIAETSAARQSLALRLEQGRDRLLELNSFRATAAAHRVQAIRQQDEDRTLDEFMVAVLDHYGIHVEELAPRAYQLGSAGVFTDAFPGLPAEGLTVTCERRRALSREDIQFLTWDHPLVTGGLDLLLGSGAGNCSFALWPDPKVSALYLETVHLLECIAPPVLHVDRFLPPTPLRIVVDHRGVDVGAAVVPAMTSVRLKPGNPFSLLDQTELRDELLPTLLKAAARLAQQASSGHVEEARRAAAAQLQHEIARLRELQKVNRSVRPEEISILLQQQSALDEHIRGARLRLDAVRWIQRGPLFT